MRSPAAQQSAVAARDGSRATGERAADPEERARVARKIVDQLKDWGRACPAYRDALDDCAEEVAWESCLRPSAAGPGEGGSDPLHHAANGIRTKLLLWAELHPVFARSLRSCAEEVELLAARHTVPDENLRSRDLVLEALGNGYQTTVQIAQVTGLRMLRVQRAIWRLIQLGLARELGCGALTPADGNRTRLYELTRTLVAQKRAAN